MYPFNLTYQQIRYLIYIKDSSEEENITSMARAFECSKVNSKNILDRMVKMGLLYKDKNNFKFTHIGDEVVESLLEKRNRLKLMIQSVYRIQARKATEYANLLIHPDMEKMADQILKYFDLFKTPLPGRNIGEKDLLKILGPGKYRIYFNILKNKSRRKDSHIPQSMAMMGFEKEAYLQLNTEGQSYILMTSRVVSRVKGKYRKEGILTDLTFFANDREQIIPSQNRQFKIPLKVLEDFNYIGNFMYQSAIGLKTSVRVNMGYHREESEFLFTLNLLAI